MNMSADVQNMSCSDTMANKCTNNIESTNVSTSTSNVNISKSPNVSQNNITNKVIGENETEESTEASDKGNVKQPYITVCGQKDKLIYNWNTKSMLQNVKVYVVSVHTFIGKN